MSSLDDILKRLKTWEISESEILVRFTLSSPQASFSFAGYVAEAEESEVRFVGLDESGDDLIFRLRLEDVESLSLSESPVRIDVDFKDGEKLWVAVAPNVSKPS